MKNPLGHFFKLNGISVYFVELKKKLLRHSLDQILSCCFFLNIKTLLYKLFNCNIKKEAIRLIGNCYSEYIEVNMI